jgi:hypothetical protein
MTSHPGVLDDPVMPPPRISSKAKSHDPLTWPVAGLVDEMLACYVDWREDAAAVDDAYTRWLTAPAQEKAQCYSAYFASLDREESAAAGYAFAVRKLERQLRRARR